MITATFQNRISKSNSNGGYSVVVGPCQVFVDEIQPDAPQDWVMGPKMKVGEFGVFLGNPIHPRGHSPYAIATGKTEEEARGKASGFFEALYVEPGTGRRAVRPSIEWAEA